MNIEIIIKILHITTDMFALQSFRMRLYKTVSSNSTNVINDSANRENPSS